ncbi:MAG: hypothetical protein ACLFV7_15240, partial [Phycisphaerae bacterium]
AVLANVLGVLSLRRHQGARAVLGQATWLFWPVMAWAVLLLHGPAKVRLQHALDSLPQIVTQDTIAKAVAVLPALAIALAAQGLMRRGAAEPSQAACSDQ